MNDLFYAALLGFVEGLTEFIPVSSTAHLIALVEGLDFPAPPGHVFEVFIQLGAILAVMCLYWKKLWLTAVRLPYEEKARNFAVNLVLGTLPALAVGALAHHWIKSLLYNPLFISFTLVLGGIVILIAEKKLPKGGIEDVDEISPKKAFLIGCCQMVALIPGVSRSGATIIGSMALGLARPAAAEFSFFLAIPVMLAAVTYDLLQNWRELSGYPHLDLMAVGFVSAFVTAMVVIRLALRLIGRYGFVPFAWYRIAAGLLIFAVFSGMFPL